MKIRRCDSCSIYTLEEKCPKCGKDTKSPHPPRYSPEDKYGKYRRRTKKKMEK